ncbi:biotin--[acetyl-CoA-carboxylase] ligase [Alkaliphilus oremlandii]|uniref:Bifunctional ligase/repressor BirA n=1 Tax=Alkaliphilus oremlandii (strain OhILAs) TaxID=350688 RepID=A8MLT9_ALKOO|nr:biotin--[acetyl-CoA-carboxylase] ligase [Alkaliphilus oremlandii]ABW18006.1 biotin--acetyl-CoA-carboxylase ligase [Alkaliphilus oremlandii OhILAs]
MRNKILEALYANKGNYVSGEILKEKLGISRTAVWKHIKILQDQGYNIQTAPRKGYVLFEADDKLLSKEIESLLWGHTMGRELIVFDSIDSTNTYGKNNADHLMDGTIILSEEQLAGRGRRGKDWSSPKGTGIWMSMVLKPDIPPTEGVKTTQIAAAAVCKAIRDLTGLDALIKWPNDIVVNGRKVCGILTEMAGQLNKIDYIVVGIGINVNNTEFPEGISAVATSLQIEYGKKIDRKELIVRIIKNFEALYHSYIENLNLTEVVAIVRDYSAVIGKEIKVIHGTSERIVTVHDIDEEGFLIVESGDGKREVIFSGEVSIRGKNGYI